MTRADRKARKAARWALGGGEPPERITLPVRHDPLVLWDDRDNDVSAGIRNMWRGQSAFLLGGGPSLNYVDVSRLNDRGVLSLGVNNVAGYVPCNAFCCGDPAMKFAQCIWHDGRIMKFLPRRQLRSRVRRKVKGRFLWDTYAAGDCPAVYGIDRGTQFDPDTFFATEYASWGAKGGDQDSWYNLRFTLFVGFRLLHFLGVKKIYWLGVDFKKEGELKYAFEQDKPGAVKGGDGHWWKARKMLEALKPTLTRIGLECYDVGPVSELGVWERREFDEAIADCQSNVGLPVDLTGWYTKKPLKGDDE